MQPLIDWILAHDRGGITSAAIRAAYEARNGNVPGDRAQQNQTWLQAFGAARRQQRAAAALEGAASGTTVGEALYGQLAFGDSVRIPVVLTGYDAAGHLHSVVVDVDARRDWTVDQVYAAARGAPARRGSDIPDRIVDMVIISGTYAISSPEMGMDDEE